MKRNIIPILFMMLMLCSCYKDLSTVADKSYPEISIEGDGDIISVSYGEEFVFEPECLQEGYSETDFEYLWEIDLHAGRQNDRIEIGSERRLEYKVANTPSSDPYILSLTVRNSELGFARIASWRVFVSSSLGEGLLVAHTRDNGKTSDLDLMAAAPVTYDYASDEPHYTRNLYSFANDGEPIQGRVNQMSALVCSQGAAFNVNEVVIGTDNGIFAIDPLTYTKSREGTEMFYNYDSEAYPTEAVFNLAGYIAGAIINGKYFTMICNGDSHYNPTLCNVQPNDFFHKENTSYAKLDQGAICTFNPNDGNFYCVRGWLSLSGGFTPIPGTLSFDAVGAECLGAGAINQKDHGFILVDKGGKAHFCVVSEEDKTIMDYDISGLDTKSIISCAFCDNSQIAYLASEDKINIILLSGNVLTVSTLNWAPDESDEIITNIQQYHQAWYGTRQISWGTYEFPLNTNRTQVIITTYNPVTGEGKFYLRPFNINTGKFTYSNNGVYGGFGEITAIASTLR